MFLRSLTAESEASSRENKENNNKVMEVNQTTFGPSDDAELSMTSAAPTLMNNEGQEEQKPSEDHTDGTSEAGAGKIMDMISGNKFYVLVTGSTLKAHKKVLDYLKHQRPDLQEVQNIDESDFILVFCPVVSRAGTDIEAAEKMIQNKADIKPAVLVVLHHTFDPECVVPDSNRAIKRKKSIAVDCLFHEDQGLLQCHKNNESLTRIRNIINPQVSIASSYFDHLMSYITLPGWIVGQIVQLVLSSTDDSSENKKQREEKMEKEQDPKTNGKDSNEASSSESSQLRLVLLGRTGSGKSAAGNTILGKEERNQADTSIATSTSTQQSESTQGEVAGRKLTVVDTPDRFAPELSLEKLRQDVGLCVHLSAPGPHTFLLVIPVKQPTGEERGMLEKMEEMFGEACWETAFLLCDKDSKMSIDEFHSDQEVQRLVEKCGNRFHCLNFKEIVDGSHIEVRDRQLKEKDRQIEDKEKDRQTEEKDRQLKERDRQLEERDRQLKEKDRQLEERDRQLKEKDRQIEEREMEEWVDLQEDLQKGD